MHRRVFAFVIVGYIVYQQGYNGYHSHFFCHCYFRNLGGHIQLSSKRNWWLAFSQIIFYSFVILFTSQTSKIITQCVSHFLYILIATSTCWLEQHRSVCGSHHWNCPSIWRKQTVKCSSTTTENEHHWS